MAGEAPKPAGGLWLEVLKVGMMPLVTATVGFFINASLNERQTRDNNVRVYAEVMGRREEADSSLRKDMFKSILDTFLSKDSQGSPAERIDRQILNLELLAYNFHESLDLGPLFKHVQAQIAPSSPGSGRQQGRLEKMARDLASREVTVLAETGAAARAPVDLDELKRHPEGITLSWHGRAGPDSTTAALRMKGRSLENTCRQFAVEVLGFEKSRREFHVRLIVSKPLPGETCSQQKADVHRDAEVDIDFRVDTFDFPMIDSTRLSQGQRCALVVTDVNDAGAELALVYFPGSRASLKDKPYYDEVMKELLRRRDFTE